MRRATTLASSWRAAEVSAALLAFAPAAFAQAPLPPDLNLGVTPPLPARSQRPAEPLPPGMAQRLQRAIDLRASGLPERARDTLLVLLRAAPHHPLIVTELGRAQLSRQDWEAVE